MPAAQHGTILERKGLYAPVPKSASDGQRAREGPGPALVGLVPISPPEHTEQASGIPRTRRHQAQHTFLDAAKHVVGREEQSREALKHGGTHRPIDGSLGHEAVDGLGDLCGSLTVAQERCVSSRFQKRHLSGLEMCQGGGPSRCLEQPQRPLVGVRSQGFLARITGAGAGPGEPDGGPAPVALR